MAEKSATPTYDGLSSLEKAAINHDVQKHLQLERSVKNPLPDLYLEAWVDNGRESRALGSKESINELVDKFQLDIAKSKASGGLNGVSGGSDVAEHTAHPVVDGKIVQRGR